MARTARTDGTLDSAVSNKYDEGAKGEIAGVVIKDKAISRKVVTLDGEEVRVAKFQFAELSPDQDASGLVNAMLALSEGETTEKKLAYIAETFNTGRYSEVRASINNELGGLSDEQKAFNRVVSAMKQLPQFKSLTDDKLIEMLKGQPGLMAMFGGEQPSEEESAS